MPGYYEGHCGSPDSSGFATPSSSFETSCMSIDNSDPFRSHCSQDKPSTIPNGSKRTIQCKTNGIASVNFSPSSVPHSAALNSTFNVEHCNGDANTDVRTGELNRKRAKKSFEPKQKVIVNDSSPDDISVHSFKLRRLRSAVFSHRTPELDCDTPHSGSSSLDLDSSQCPLTISARTSSSFLISSGDSSRDDALLSMSVARAFSGSVPRLPLHCPTPMTNASSPSPTLKTREIVQSDNGEEDSRFELSNTSEENTVRDDEIIKELTALAFVKNQPRRGCLVDSVATSTCSSPKVKKRVRFNNVPLLIRRSTQDSSPDCKEIVPPRERKEVVPPCEPPAIRHTRSSRLRAQFVQQRQRQLNAANQRTDSSTSSAGRHRSTVDLKRNRRDALISPATSSRSSSVILSPSRVPKKVFRK